MSSVYSFPTIYYPQQNCKFGHHHLMIFAYSKPLFSFSMWRTASEKPQTAVWEAPPSACSTRPSANSHLHLGTDQRPSCELLHPPAWASKTQSAAKEPFF